ncbi:MAG: PhzF family phenazine biosynthesis isomerase [Cyanobacteria bacterium]|jgi:PhzF family phenazine biosynthesis protein|nr:PhzF family phenazine biosynthesis isomerase [Cyanobacteria bacterium GSL.Bin1]
MKQTIIQVDAFTNTPFSGNPAAVCVLTEPQSDQWMQQVAAEMNLSETAFLHPHEDDYALRWFTPTTEVPLCGHATLASAHVLWSEGYLPLDQSARFDTKSGLLTATRHEDWIELNFPAATYTPIAIPEPLPQALGMPVQSVQVTDLGYLVEVDSADRVKQMQPDLGVLARLEQPNAIVTSLAKPESAFDIVSRFFAPGLGIPEDPVTGAAHCVLGPYWCRRRQQDTLLAYQASPRGGVVKVSYDGSDRVSLSGQAVTVFRAEII